MSYTIRNSIKVILLNDKKEILLLQTSDPKTTSINKKYHGKFWSLIGGKIEESESLEQAVLREIHEETGIKKDEIELGPIVWFGEFDLILSGIPTHLKQKFIVAKTKQTKLSLDNLTQEEQKVIKKLEWFSLEKIKDCKEVIYPVLLPKYLPDIIAEKYPEKPLEIDLTKKPT